MSIYAIGDVQGCYRELMALLDKIAFQPDEDELWFSGDLVNRGPQSLEVLRFVYQLGNRHKVVLGNHDFHLLAIQCGARKLNSFDTLQSVLDAPDCDELLAWLRSQPLMHYDEQRHAVLTHAGVCPFWTVEQASQLARELETALQGHHYKKVLANLFGNKPGAWDDSLAGFGRLRCIVNYFTRMRFCYADGRLDFQNKGKIGSQPSELYPWFAVPGRVSSDALMLFGHWAALEGATGKANVVALDTGCAWGQRLTAVRLDDLQAFSVHAMEVR